METTFQIPDLPHDKKYHLFVCYERNSLCIVEEIVDNLEKEGVVCCYYERDFTPGRSITDNMYEAIEQQIALKEDSNGEYSAFDLEAYKPSRFSLERYRLKITEMDRARLWTKKFEVSAELLQEIEDTVNESFFFRLYHVITHPYLLISVLYLYLLILIMIIFSILLLMSVRERPDKLTSPALCLAVGLPTWFISYIIISIVLCCCDCQKQGLFRLKLKLWDILREKLWKISRRTHQQTGVIFFLKQHTFMETKFEFYVMRINFKPCQLYFERQLAKEDKAYLKKEMASYESPEEYTSRIFDIFLERYCEKLTEISINRRHNMNNGAKCVCLHIDNYYAEKYINRLKLGLF
ncbi:uncharacterized protein LOC132717690 isoform X3 [Ruditapes philippinarum]|uniref:uncharacterized protein LOC132717690 isoform X3 n=1 Tax=Ruditapes philippinarum TaxID=129788 RepID=UPI00295C029D|nr:uncharacterized protein LOC132717690 isoform X3 [Ruditapes philippinarum]